MIPLRRAALFLLILSLLPAITMAEETDLRISLPPVYEALPIAFAQEWGLFADQGIAVEIVGITDDQERSTALMTGNLDAVMEDMTRAILDDAGGWDVVITSAADSRPQTGSISLGLVSTGSFGVDSLDELISSGQTIGTTYRSNYEYLLDKLLAAHGLTNGWINRYMYFNGVLQIAVWFGAQSIPAAVLPEPYISYLATYRPVNGEPIHVVTLSDFSEVDGLPSVIVFQRKFVADHPDVVRAFYAAYGEAIERINATPRDRLIEEGLNVVIPLFFEGADPASIPQEILDAIIIPIFNRPEDPPREKFDDVAAWMKSKGYIIELPEYEDLVDPRFIP